MRQEEIIAEYKHLMYEETPDSKKLRSGDVVRLRIDDFKKIARHDSMINLFSDFKDNPDYPENFWAILNKSCDMVHDPQNGRTFKNNLFIAPLQGLKSALRKGTLNLLHSSEGPSILNIFIDSYRHYFTGKSKRENPKKKSESHEEYSKRIGVDIVRPTIEKIKELVSVDNVGCDHPQDIVASLKQNVQNVPIHSDIVEFESSPEWKKELKKFNENQKEIKRRDSSIILKKDAEESKIADLALNQLDSQGIFFYEPSPMISNPEHDLSYLIQLEDMVTLKVSEDLKKSGEMTNLLLTKRVAMLTRSFSDRLLNIMGSYFSKIGTPDVVPGMVLGLYKKIYADSFYINIKEYEKERKG